MIKNLMIEYFGHFWLVDLDYFDFSACRIAFSIILKPIRLILMVSYCSHAEAHTIYVYTNIHTRTPFVCISFILSILNPYLEHFVCMYGI